MRSLVSTDRLWSLATSWYSKRFQRERAASAVDEMRGIFAGLGLEGDFGIHSQITLVSGSAHERRGEAPHGVTFVNELRRTASRQNSKIRFESATDCDRPQ